MGRIEKTIFISYRRSNASWALAIFQNLTGLNDPMRSSDGGAISVYDHSNPEILDNVIAATFPSITSWASRR